MPWNVTVNDDNVVLPNGRVYSDGETALLTDEEYYRIDQDLVGVGALLTDPTQVAILTAT